MVKGLMLVGIKMSYVLTHTQKKLILYELLEN